MRPLNVKPIAVEKALTEQVAIPETLPGCVDDAVWVDVIRRMDEIYVDLVEHQMELEEKNQTLERTYQQLQQAHEDLQRTQNQLIQSEKMASLGRLVAGVAHELNNPISFILGNTHTLKRYNNRLQSFFSGMQQLADPRIAELRSQNQIDRLLQNLNPLIDGSMEGADRVSEIVGALLHFTKPQQQRAMAFDAISLIKTATQWVLRSAQVKPLVIFDMPDTIPICSFEGPIHQIFINLLQNAVDVVESKTQPRVWLTLQCSVSHLTCCIRDNGPGIDSEHQGKIFDPFFTTKPAGKGTGLGLYISYLLATEQCGGKLTASNHPDGGAVFCLTLPVRVEEPVS
jgi:two-component system, NtrC family, sensor histidine kinase HupT/HoxJ